MKQLVVILIVLVSSNLHAEGLSDKLSYVTVAANITIDTIRTFRSKEKKPAIKKQIVRTVLAVGISALLKASIHEERPDGSDNKGFPSEHSVLSCMSIDSGSQNALSEFPIAFGTMTGRVVANRHNPRDVAAGCGIGLLLGLIR